MFGALFIQQVLRPSDPQVTEFDINREYTSRIVGAGGSGINKIREQLDVRIDFIDEEEKDGVDGKKKGKKSSTTKSHVKVSCRIEPGQSELICPLDYRQERECRGSQATHSLTR
jgi:polyribonucleotide nucleotidyltransferase